MAPLVIPRTPRAGAKFVREDGDDKPVKTTAGYSVRCARIGAVGDHNCSRRNPTSARRSAGASLSPNAFRHTFGTQSVATDVPLDVVQHASSQKHGICK
ncbi:hypothetical protein ACJ51O_37225 (plasmid) [Burkholderia pyrrocinia]|uniref:hypothetical protein n=1 Tax=Burkholderia cepacia complex TaxID=87882 RepID=UPI002148145A|nr:hypothetical protein [Burkholderia cepacia]